MGIVDLLPQNVYNEEVWINSRLAKVEEGTHVRFHGVFNTLKQIQAKNKTGLILNFSEAEVCNPVLTKTQYGHPIVQIAHCKDTWATGGSITGPNISGLDGVTYGLENYMGVAIGSGSVDCGVDSMSIIGTWGDAVFIGGRYMKLLTHNQRLSVKHIVADKIGRHFVSVRDCLGFELGWNQYSRLRRLFFDHEPAKLEKFEDADIHDNVGPQGGQNIWLQLLPRATTTCDRITVRNHRLTKGNFKVNALGGLLRLRTGLYLSNLNRDPSNESLLATNLTIRNWNDVHIVNVDGYS
jgi:hypothetical protein